MPSTTRVFVLPAKFAGGRQGGGLSYRLYPDTEVKDDHRKTPITIAHGLFGSKQLFDDVSRQLSDDGRKVITYDARNHGDSGGSTELDYPCMTQDLSDLIDSQGSTQNIVMGHSMGGKTVMTLALTKPEKLKAIIVVDAAPMHSPVKDAFVGYARAMRAVEFSSETRLSEARTLAKSKLSDMLPDEQILDYLLGALRKTEDGGVRWGDCLDAFINNAHLQEFKAPDGSTFNKPALFIFGEKSPIYSAEAVEKVKALFPRAEFVVIKDAGHFLYDDEPAEFVTVVQSFCERLDAGSSTG